MFLFLMLEYVAGWQIYKGLVINMPFYDLYCVDCKGEFNIMATMADKSERRIPCPDCGSLNLNTLYNYAPAVIKKSKDSMPACPRSNVCGGCIT